jgi:hypothetical protein
MVFILGFSGNFEDEKERRKKRIFGFATIGSSCLPKRISHDVKLKLRQI